MSTLPSLHIHIGFWDWATLFGVSTLATVLAYSKSPVMKASLAMFPIPFTLASLALGQPVALSNVCAIPTLLLYYVTARWLYLRWRWPIGVAIVSAVGVYALVAGSLVHILPRTEWAFWVGLGIVWLAGMWAHLKLPYKTESGHKSDMPVPVKFFIVSGVVAMVMIIKHAIQGFASVFPMVGTVAVYESRNSLWTLTRQAGVLLFTMPPMLATCHIAYPHTGLGGSLALGWVAHLAAIGFVRRNTPATHVVRVTECARP